MVDETRYRPSMRDSMRPEHSRSALHRRSPEAASALDALHAAAKEVLDAELPLGASVRVTQAHFEISLRLAWALLSFRRATSLDVMLAAMPGQQGWTTWLTRLDATIDAERVAAIRAAKDRFDRAIRAADVDLKVIASRPPGDARRHRLAWERYARESNEMYRRVWPVAGRAKIVAWAISPNQDDPGLADVVSVMLYDEIERTISGDPILIARQVIGDADIGDHLSPGIDPSTIFGRGGALPPLLEAYSAPGVVGREVQPIPDSRGGSSIGFTERDPTRTGPLFLTFGSYVPRAGPLTGGEDDSLEWSLQVQAPVEHAVLHLLWPRDLPAGGPWRVKVVAGGRPAGRITGKFTESSPLLRAPFESGRARTLDLPGPLASVLPIYRAAVAAAVGQLGRGLDDFDILQVQTRFPIPRTALAASRRLARTLA